MSTPILPSGGVIPPIPLAGLRPFEGETVLVVFNPNARQGRIASEAEPLRQSLEALGFQVEFLRTVPNPLERSQLIRNTAQRLIQNTHPQNGIHVFPVGGDGIIDETIRETLQALEIDLHQVPPRSTAQQNIQRNIRSVIIAQVGTAADIANQLGAPPHFYGIRSLFRRITGQPPPAYFSELNSFLQNTHTIPLGIPSIDTPQVHERTAFHSVGFGTSGHLFGLGEKSRSQNPTSILNRGMMPFFTNLPQAILEFGINGFIAEIEHHGRVDRVEVSDVLGTSNRLIAGVGGIPGRWGEFQMIAIPRGPHGVAVLLEASARGIMTKLGLNWVGANSSMFTISDERKITLRPGERARLRFFDRRTGAPLEIPWQLNGDSVSQRTAEAEVYVPPIQVPLQVVPNAVGERLFHQDEKRRAIAEFNGMTENPLFPLAQFESTPERQQVKSVYYPLGDLNALLQRYQLEPSRLPLLIARAHGVQHHQHLDRIASQPLAMTQIEAWLEQQEGRDFIVAEEGRIQNSFRNRLETHGVGLAMGLATFYLAEQGVERLGIHRDRDPFTHFMTTSLAAHSMNVLGNSVVHPILSRGYGLPYDWAAMEAASLEGVPVSRLVLGAESSLARSMTQSIARNFGFQMEGSLIRRGLVSSVRVPYQMIQGMGVGLAASRLTDT
ncbi:MAG: hypothetical protein JNK65_03935, partial [Deltaproteobacteria bacterium]|nr:hypothetical protein [Deltaproteobacteria bacterium]